MDNRSISPTLARTIKILFILLLIVFIGIFLKAKYIYNGIGSARRTSEILKTPSDKLNPKDLSTKNTVLDRDIDIMLANSHFFVFEPYFKVTRATDGHRTYLGMCSAYSAKSVLDRLKNDSTEEPVCRDSDNQAIIFVTNNEGKILCIDNQNINAIVLTNKPVGLNCK